MTQRSVWKGTLGFGMVSIPVKLYSATETKKISFNQIHRDCQSRIQMPKWCPTCERKVEAAELVKGYPLSKDQYILIEESDLSSLPIKTLKTVEMVDFVDSSFVDSRQVEKSYFLAPEAVGAKAFSLFLKAMQRKGKVGIAKLAFREREHLSTIKPMGDIMLLQTLYYSDELRDPGDVTIKLPDVSNKELEMAETLIEMQSGGRNLAEYEDEYRLSLLEVVQAKINGEVLTAKPLKEPEPMDLIEALTASINAQPQPSTLGEHLDTIAKTKCPNCEYQAWSDADLASHMAFAHKGVMYEMR